LADEPVRKRAVPASRSAATKASPTKRAPRAARPPLEDETRSTNYALRLTEGLEQAAERAPAPTSTVRRGLRPPAPAVSEHGDTFALRLTEALEAINAAQNSGAAPAGPAVSSGEPERGTLRGVLAALEKLPPIRLPIGPAIPWRVGLPALVALVVVMGVMSRSAVHADAPGVQLPAQQTYPVQQEAPLFAKPADEQSTDTPAPGPQPLGVQESPGLGFDLADIAIKLIAVLGLAYGSLLLLKRAGVGASSKGGGSAQAMRIVSSLALAPNRSVHVIKVPGGRTLLVGATPNAVNLLADLGALADDETPEASSFLDGLKGKLS
jgi:flagellar biogenesis protein FliO